MSNQSINAALSMRLQALGLPTYFENAPGFVPPADALYLAEAFMPSDTFAVGMEDGSTDDFKGLYQVTVMALRDGYKLGGFVAANSVAGQFKRGTALTNGGVSVRCERVTQESARLSGDRWAIPVSIYYRAFVRG